MASRNSTSSASSRSSAIRKTGSSTSTAPRAGLDLIKPTAPWISATWRASSGRSRRYGTRVSSMRATGSCRIPGRLQTPLSNFETRLDNSYRERTDPTLTVAFRLHARADGPGPMRILAWTTTPWTLPSNLALAVIPRPTYAAVARDGEYWIMAESALRTLPSEFPEAEVVRTFPGLGLIGRTYEPLFPFFSRYRELFRRPGGELRRARRGHRRRPYGACFRRGRHGGVRTPPAFRLSSPSTSRAISPPRCCLHRPERLSRRTRTHPRPQGGARRGRAPRDLRCTTIRIAGAPTSR